MTMAEKIWHQKGSEIWGLLSCTPRSNFLLGPLDPEAIEYRKTLLSFFNRTTEAGINCLGVTDESIELVKANKLFGIETLSVLIEQKKLAEEVRREDKIKYKSSPLFELINRLLETWMNEDTCATLISQLSLINSLSKFTVTNRFLKLLFSIQDLFHLKLETFQAFILHQFGIAFATCCVSIESSNHDQNGEATPTTIDTLTLATLLDKFLLRFSINSAYILSDGKLEVDSDLAPFSNFLYKFSQFAATSFIAKRLCTKTLLRLTSRSGEKLLQLAIRLEDSVKQSVLSSLFYPLKTFLDEKSWYRCILNGFLKAENPKRLQVWTDFGVRIYQEEKSAFVQLLNEACTHFIALCDSQCSPESALVPATCGVVALVKAFKTVHKEAGSPSSQDFFSLLSDVRNLHAKIVNLIDDLNTTKQACALSVSYVMLKLYIKGNDAEQSSLECDDPLFSILTDFFDDDLNEKNDKQVSATTVLKETPVPKDFEILDSDDEDKSSSSPATFSNSFQDSEFQPYDISNDKPIDDRLQDMSEPHKKVPNDFVTIIETFTEDAPNTTNEYEKSVLKEMAVLKIPVFLYNECNIGFKDAFILARCLIEWDCEDPAFKLPILLSLYEISKAYPSEVFGLLGRAVYDRDHYSYGTSLKFIDYLNILTRLSSKSSCIVCIFSEGLIKLRKKIEKIYPEFFSLYFDKQVQSKKELCASCKKQVKGILELQAAEDKEKNLLMPMTKPLSWREIVDQRIALKTKYFSTKLGKKEAETEVDEFSVKYAPVIWSSVANSLIAYAQKDTVGGGAREALISHVLRLLGSILLSTSGVYCLSYASFASHVGEIFCHFRKNKSSDIRHAALCLLAITATHGDGKTFVLDALTSSSGSNFLEMLKDLSAMEKKYGYEDNKGLAENLAKYLTSAALTGVEDQVAMLSA